MASVRRPGLHAAPAPAQASASAWVPVGSLCLARSMKQARPQHSTGRARPHQAPAARDAPGPPRPVHSQGNGSACPARRACTRSWRSWKDETSMGRAMGVTFVTATCMAAGGTGGARARSGLGASVGAQAAGWAAGRASAAGTGLRPASVAGTSGGSAAQRTTTQGSLGPARRRGRGSARARPPAGSPPGTAAPRPAAGGGDRNRGLVGRQETSRNRRTTACMQAVGGWVGGSARQAGRQAGWLAGWAPRGARCCARCAAPSRPIPAATSAGRRRATAPAPPQPQAPGAPPGGRACRRAAGRPSGAGSAPPPRPAACRSSGRPPAASRPRRRPP